jgi:peroxiredoxin
VDGLIRTLGKAMKSWQFVSGFLMIVLAGHCAGAADIGSKVANFQLSDTSEKTYSLRSYSGNVVVLVFWSFKCPVSLAYVDQMEEIRKKYEGKKVVLLEVASSPNETPEEIRANLANLNMKLPVLLDTEGIVAEKLGATHTPSAFIIDGGAVLRYTGALDNNKKLGENGRIPYLTDALDSILSGRVVSVSETRPVGCSIKLFKSGDSR